MSILYMSSSAYVSVYSFLVVQEKNLCLFRSLWLDRRYLVSLMRLQYLLLWLNPMHVSLLC